MNEFFLSLFSLHFSSWAREPDCFSQNTDLRDLKKQLVMGLIYEAKLQIQRGRRSQKPSLLILCTPLRCLWRKWAVPPFNTGEYTDTNITRTDLHVLRTPSQVLCNLYSQGVEQERTGKQKEGGLETLMDGAKGHRNTGGHEEELWRHVRGSERHRGWGDREKWEEAGWMVS